MSSFKSRGLLSPYGIIDKLTCDASAHGVNVTELTVDREFYLKLVDNLGDNVVIAKDRDAVVISCLTNVVTVVCADD